VGLFGAEKKRGGNVETRSKKRKNFEGLLVKHRYLVESRPSWNGTQKKTDSVRRRKKLRGQKKASILRKRGMENAKEKKSKPAQKSKGFSVGVNQPVWEFPGWGGKFVPVYRKRKKGGWR